MRSFKQSNEQTAETNRLITKAVKITYKKLTNVQKQSPKKILTHVKTTKKTYKTVRFVDGSIKETRDNNELLKRRDDIHVFHTTYFRKYLTK